MGMRSYGCSREAAVGFEGALWAVGMMHGGIRLSVDCGAAACFDWESEGPGRYVRLDLCSCHPEQRHEGISPAVVFFPRKIAVCWALAVTKLTQETDRTTERARSVFSTHPIPLHRLRYGSYVPPQDRP